MPRRIGLGRLAAGVAGCGLMALAAQDAGLAECAAFGLVAGAGVGGIRAGVRGSVEGAAFGFVAGMLSPLLHFPAAMAFAAVTEMFP